MAYPDKIPMTPITIRVSQGSYEAIEDIARDNALSKAEVMRLAMNGQLQTHLRRVRFADEDQGNEIRALAVRLCDEVSAIRMELNRIGVNYNQMARLKNAEHKQGIDLTPAIGTDLTKSDLDALMARFEKASEEVAELCGLLV